MPEIAVLLPAENGSVAGKKHLGTIHCIGYLHKRRDIAGYCELASETEPSNSACPKIAARDAGETGCPPETARRPRRRRIPRRASFGRILRRKRAYRASSIIAKWPQPIFAVMGFVDRRTSSRLGKGQTLPLHRAAGCGIMRNSFRAWCPEMLCDSRDSRERNPSVPSMGWQWLA